MRRSEDELYAEAMQIGLTQWKDEIMPLMRFFHSLQVKRFLEIGSEYGGSFYLFCQHCEPLAAISVDLPYSPRWLMESKGITQQQRDDRMRSFSPNAHVIVGDSHAQETLLSVKKILNGELLDFLFIDGDHSYAGVLNDFLTYSPLVKPGGWVGFHDVTPGATQTPDCARAFKSISDGKPTLMFDKGDVWGGIGLVQVY